jgi:hypothetical protein
MALFFASRSRKCFGWPERISDGAVPMLTPLSKTLYNQRLSSFGAPFSACPADPGGWAGAGNGNPKQKRARDFAGMPAYHDLAWSCAWRAVAGVVPDVLRQAPSKRRVSLAIA